MNFPSTGFVVFLLCLPAMQSEEGWRLTYGPPHNICAAKGSTVEIRCSVSPTLGENVTGIRVFWFAQSALGAVDLTTRPEYAGRVQYGRDGDAFTLRVWDLRVSDSAEYRLGLTTNPPRAGVTGTTGVQLSVTDQAEVQKKGQYLECHSNSSDSVSCAVRGMEDLRPPSVCVESKYCHRVFYPNRKICAFKGSSVSISCIHTYPWSGYNKLWFRRAHSHQTSAPSQPTDLKKDPNYSGRVEVESSDSSSALTIKDLKDSDSAEYYFTYSTPWATWGSDLRGTTLTVAALQVRLMAVHVSEGYTFAQLKCDSSCSPADPHSFIWFNDDRRIQGETSAHLNLLYLGGRISCAADGSEKHRAPAVYAPDSPFVSVNVSGDIVAGDVVTLTCTTDANPAAAYSWNKRNKSCELQPPSADPRLVFPSIRPSDSGEYYCTAQNKLGRRASGYVLVDVKYAPRPPSVSASPCAQIVEGGSVNLSCSSDANPAANYSWYKEGEDSPEVSGQTLTIVNAGLKHGGTYYCEAHNGRGRQRSGLHLVIVSIPGSMHSAVSGSITVVFLAAAGLLAFIFWRRRTSNKPSEAGDSAQETVAVSAAAPGRPAEGQDSLPFASAQFHNNQEDSLYSNVVLDQQRRQKPKEGEVVYSLVNFDRPRRQSSEDPSALYSTVTTA
ncbi:unnamed protein product [Menidia menidia]|uniref:(Atlantic silverside) hypothetical protein n=1 Tax=Menidia menidia TaxID=238744 RepID=A0A8S4BAQ2_9TELE|nr:unnamed protein product [Menidia menidia]